MVNSGVYGCIRYDVLDDDEIDSIVKRKEINKLIRQGKISIEGNEVWIARDDNSTRQALDEALYGYDVNY